MAETPRTDFVKVSEPDPHLERRRRILRAHPGVKALLGPNPWSALLVAALVAAQFSLAFLLRDAPAWKVMLMAALAGAYISASLFALIHEASHALVFRGRTANYLIGLTANLPLVLWNAVPFFRYHLWHHRALGDHEKDVGVPAEAEARWVGNSRWRKAVWLAFFTVFQALRTVKFSSGGRPYWTGWMKANMAVQVAVDVLVLRYLGFASFAYLGLSIYFTLGFHPLGTRAIQEHFVLEDGQETNNYSGWGNWLECNFGYHIEHHDFPGIPWNRLPSVRRLAPEFYDNKRSFPSRLKLMIEFITDSSWSIYRNTVRLRTAPVREAPASHRG